MPLAKMFLIRYELLLDHKRKKRRKGAGYVAHREHMQEALGSIPSSTDKNEEGKTVL